MKMGMRVSFVLAVLAVVVMTCSCASTSSGGRGQGWPYQEKAIHLHLKADKQLNLFQRSPHALVLCVYQLRDPNAFNEIKDQKDGLSKLFECSRFDSSVVGSKKLVMQPDQELKESIDRLEGTNYVALVAGYYSLDKEQSVRLMPIPLESGFFSFSWLRSPRPAELDMKFYLGSREIQELKETKEK